MMIASIPGIPTMSPWGYVPQGLSGQVSGLGDIDTSSNTTTLSVKEYTLSNGARVWASYESPASNSAIKAMKTALARFTRVTGVAVTIDGLISSVTVSAVQTAAQYAIANDLAALGYLVKGAAVNPKTLAERAHVVGRLLNDIANQLNIGGPVVQTTPRPSGSSSPTPAPADIPGLPPDLFPVQQNAMPAFNFGKKHWAYYAAGAVLFVGLGAAAYLVWKE